MLSFYRFSHFKQYSSLIHAVTNKSKDKPYSFSLALHTGEAEKSIVGNRQMLAKKLQSNTPLLFIVANQTHSSNIKIINQASTHGWRNLSDAIEDCDALITDIPHVVLTILTADCVPVLLYDPKQEVIAAVHAGWKGSKENIVKKTVQTMTNIYNSNPSDIYAGIAPTIGRCCYEVGEDVAKHFSNIPKSYTQKQTKYMLDLPHINKQQLLDIGLKEKNIEMSHICTSCDVEHYFSYRKENGCSGRFMSLIALKGKINEN